MAHKTGRPLTREDYTVIMQTFGFIDVDEFMQFVFHQETTSHIKRIHTHHAANDIIEAIDPRPRPMVLGSGLV
jgi:hypothetical protein